ncbi:HNH endonuclease [Lacticaseibacillus paracasei]|uniref:HNH endonuclease n=1 Tax=Lacticaseibacillus paracasei TaxID=1597 RepID=UPI000FF35505|nr:HNH endonuclease [Lacticaseibacillus paracasei]RWZ63301.1 HNH endonuclease [Lacticaseibacillus paracasei]
MKISDFVVGEIYKNSEIREAFKVSLMRGMARGKRTNSLVLISKHVKASKANPYEDKWIGEKLHYTGEGQRGNQSLTSGQNRTLAESSSNGVTLYLFEVLKQGEYSYRGLVSLDDPPYEMTEKDSDGNSRIVYKFPLTLIGGN